MNLTWLFFKVDSNEEKNHDLNEFAKDFESSLVAEKLTDISTFRRKMEPLAKKIFLGKFNHIIFSYPGNYFLLSETNSLLKRAKQWGCERFSNNGFILKQDFLLFIIQAMVMIWSHMHKTFFAPLKWNFEPKWSLMLAVQNLLVTKLFNLVFKPWPE